MKYVILFVLLAFGNLNSYAQDQLLYENNKNLTWDNFKGSPDMNAWQSAVTATQIKMELKGEQTLARVIVECVFVQSRSWVKPNHKQHTLLMHERGHFELRELYARMLRKEISQLKVTPKNVSKKVIKLYKKYNKLSVKANKLYDKESDFSRNKAGQAKWSVYLQKELKKYEKYKGSIVVLRYS